MSHLSNPLATPSQLYPKASSLPVELRDTILFHTARLTQAAGILLRLPQDITAQANVLLFRYWIVESLMDWEFSDVSAAVLYLTAKISASPRSLRSITNVYAYLLSASSSLAGTKPDNEPESYYLSESAYITFRNRLLNIEGHVLDALGFNTHVSLPHPLAITYLQTLDVFSLPGNKGKAVAKRTIEYLNVGLLSPQMLYLTHQPNALAVASIYLSARETGAKMPDVEWWEVFDVDREELGFLVVGLGSLEGLAKMVQDDCGGKGMVTRDDIRKDLATLEIGTESRGEDEEAEMARLLDEKVGAA